MTLFPKNSSMNPIFLSLITILIVFSCQNLSVSSFEYQVGGSQGWVVPPSNATTTYNDWASKKRFQIGDTIRFKYKKDSVMEVSEEDYRKCNSSHPRFFSNNGKTVFRFNYSGPFYFISGMSGHCEKGQKMIIKVIAQDEDEDEPSGSSSTASPAAAAVLSIWVCFLLFLQSVFSCVASYYVCY